jgi:hypothetical protein
MKSFLLKSAVALAAFFFPFSESFSQLFAYPVSSYSWSRWNGYYPSFSYPTYVNPFPHTPSWYICRQYDSGWGRWNVGTSFNGRCLTNGSSGTYYGGTGFDLFTGWRGSSWRRYNSTWYNPWYNSGYYGWGGATEAKNGPHNLPQTLPNVRFAAPICKAGLGLAPSAMGSVTCLHSNR